MMQNKRPFSCLIVAIYDLFRFAVLSVMLALLLAAPSDGGITVSGVLPRVENMPLPFYLAPLALFPIMAFFLWHDPAVMRSFSRLYIAGKALCIAAGAFWCFEHLSLRGFLILLRFGNSHQWLYHALVPLLIIWDAAAIIAISLAARKRLHEA